MGDRSDHDGAIWAITMAGTRTHRMEEQPTIGDFLQTIPTHIDGKSTRTLLDTALMRWIKVVNMVLVALDLSELSVIARTRVHAVKTAA